MERIPQARNSDFRSSRTAGANLAALGEPWTAHESLLALQDAAGNRATTQLIQAKLKVGSVGDAHEHEADRAAAQVAGGRSSSRTQSSIPTGSPTPAPADVEHGIARARGGGRPLPADVRGQMEHALGAGFGDVRVHIGIHATELNDRLAARAFTTGNDIFVRNGEPDPTSATGRQLIAHELTHVAQQADLGTTPSSIQRLAVGGEKRPDEFRQREDEENEQFRARMAAEMKDLRDTMQAKDELGTYRRDATDLYDQPALIPVRPDRPEPKRDTTGRPELEEHIAQRGKDQQAAAKWNVAGDGRSQGLVHLIDYSFARPPMTKTDPRAKDLSADQQRLLDRLDRGMMSESELRAGFADEKQYKAIEPFLEERLREVPVDPADETKGTRQIPAGIEEKEWADLVGDAVNPAGALSTTAAQKEAALKVDAAALKRAGFEGRALGEEMRRRQTQLAESAAVRLLDDKMKRIRAARRFGPARDESKAGRLAKIEAAGKQLGVLGDTDDIRGRELELGTRVGTGLVDRAAAKVGEPKAPTRGMDVWSKKNEWVTTGHNKHEQRPRWKEELVPKETLQHTGSAEVEAMGVKAKLWGVHEDATADEKKRLAEMKLSTLF